MLKRFILVKARYKLLLQSTWEFPGNWTGQPSQFMSSTLSLIYSFVLEVRK